MSKLTKIFWISIGVSVLFTVLIMVLPNSINNYYDNPEIYDTGFNYHLWKFRAIDASNIARITAWSFFALHFGSVAVLLKKLKTEKRNEDGFSNINVYLLLTNAFFVVLHYIHTWVWYDALAQDTPVWSSQGSVVIMLVLILIIENGRRGLFFGKKVPFPKESLKVIMKSHGIYITLATVFTFWYHPMEFTWGHLFGFFYMFLLFIQMSMSNTRIHSNKVWIVVLELTVLFHGTVVALTTNFTPFRMFIFGFGMIFFITQIYGLGLQKNVRLAAQIVFVVLLLFIYSGILPGIRFADINEAFRIPVIEYLLVFVFVYVIYLPIWFNKKVKVPKIINKVLSVLLITILVLSSAMIIFANNPYEAEVQMYEEMDIETYVTKTETGSSIVFEPESYAINIVMIPGGKVKPEAYSYVASELANNGMKVTIVKPLLNLAIFSPNQANKYVEEGKTNVVMGHSLGGVVASMVASNNEDFDVLIMMGAYNTSPITNQETLAITSEHDSLDMEKYNEQALLVDDLTEEHIDGGNHAYFGFYGEQKGDGEAEMTNLEQQKIVVYLITTYLNN